MVIAILVIAAVACTTTWTWGSLQVSSLRAIPSPEEFLGYSIGDNYKLTYYGKIVEYLKLIDALSDRVIVEEIGKTIGGKPLIAVIVSHPENLAKLDYYRDITRKLSDPRTTHPDDALHLSHIGKPIVYMIGGQHINEVDPPESTMQFVYELATRNDEKTLNILRNVIVVIVPSANPDGYDVYIDWYYNYTTKTPYVSARPPRWGPHPPYEIIFDWAALNLNETQIITENILYWRPQIVIDNHQTWYDDYRMYIPPMYYDPINPNIHPMMIHLMYLMGGYIGAVFETHGLSGYVREVPGFDLFAPLYTDVNMNLRNIVGMTWEIAGFTGADPIYISPNELASELTTYSLYNMRPWLGGWWTLKDQVKYRLTGWWALLEHVALNKHVYLYYTYMAAKEQVELGREEPPYAFIIPYNERDPAYLCEMINKLIKLGIEVRTLQGPFMYEGITYPAGTYVVLMDQPYRGLAKTLLEPQVIKTRQAFWDVTAWTYGYLWNAPVVAVDDKGIFSVGVSEPLAICTPPKGVVLSPATYAYVFNHTHTGIKLLNELLREGLKVQFYGGPPITVDGVLLEPGAIIVPVSNVRPINFTYMRSLAEKYGLTIYALNTTIKARVYEIPREPRIALYWPLRFSRQSADAYWISMILRNHNFSHDIITCENITKVDLSKYDVIIIPDESVSIIGAPPSPIKREIERIVTGVDYPIKNGIGIEGLEKLKKFAREGGTVVVLNRASGLAVIYNITPDIVLANPDMADVFLSGVILRAYVNTSHFLAYGIAPEIGVYALNSPYYIAPSTYVVAKYPDDPTKLWMSGYLEGAELLAGKSILLDVPYGKGRFIMFGFTPTYRAQSPGTYIFLFNAIYYSVAR